MKKNKYAIIIFMLLLAFTSFKDRLIDSDTNVVLTVCIAFIAMASFIAYLKFKEDKKSHF